MSAQDIYASLWETMERDFKEKLDAPTFDKFQENLATWSGIHTSEATQEVGLAVWETLHEPTIVEAEGITGHYRNRFDGRFASKEDFDAQ